MRTIGERHLRGQDTDYRDACDVLGNAFDPARTLIETAVPLSVAVARRMQTSQSRIARMEDWTVRPSAAALKRVAQARRRRLRSRADLPVRCVLAVAIGSMPVRGRRSSTGQVVDGAGL